MAATYVVTGASTGIGEACARRLAAAGHRVLAGVRRVEDGERLRSVISGDVEPVLVDITDRAQVEAMAARVDEVVGAAGLAGLVNNAGIGIGGPIELLPLDEWRTQLEVNVIGQVSVTQVLLPLLRRGHGRVVFIGSINGRVTVPLLGPYSASKHAIEAVAETLREEVRPWGIAVSVVEPGMVRTPIWDKAAATADRLEQELTAEGRELYAEPIAKVRASFETGKRVGVDPDDVAKVVEKALNSPRPWSRYLVGSSAKVAGMLDRVLPDRALASLVRRMDV